MKWIRKLGGFGASILMGAAGAGVGMACWALFIVLPYEAFIGRGAWGGNAMPYFHPGFHFWSQVVSAGAGFLGGFVLGVLMFFVKPYLDEEKKEKLEPFMCGAASLVALPLYVMLFPIGLAIVLAMTVGYVGFLTVQDIRGKLEKC